MSAPRLVFGLMRAERGVRRWIDARAGHAAVGAAGAGVLFHLARHEPSTVTDVARALEASPAGATGLLNRLAASGVIEKSTDPDDARVVRVRLTDAGRALLPEAAAALADLNAALTAGFTPAELEVVDRWLAQAAGIPRDRS
ncbi:MarR family transcriptional regulator [Protaetiibacter sp. SSC-01]|uniref:MarR family winged helix-turn-helix transcriptional regulator n=1 Tax=Protaetiibacter sp. SSC-01 TaxID=2759943 RepID=UPI001656ED82|nr:MarR family transcriptional regulator [Protaetiibacter sp. SSC-01]QNO37635.1 MarR family transcriptional regulator [Protaetiibacter sp. SSC-01]